MWKCPLGHLMFPAGHWGLGRSDVGVPFGAPHVRRGALGVRWKRCGSALWGTSCSPRGTGGSVEGMWECPLGHLMFAAGHWGFGGRDVEVPFGAPHVRRGALGVR